MATQIQILPKLLKTVERIRHVDLSSSYGDEDGPASQTSGSSGLLQQLQQIVKILNSAGYARESTAVADVLAICAGPTYRGGLGLSESSEITADQESEIMFLLSAWLESLNSADRAKYQLPPLKERPSSRRGMSVTEKIFAMHDIDKKGQVKPGQLVRVDVDWVMASEAMWPAMEKTYEELGKPEIHRNDRFWLAGDHVVDPRVNHLPQVKKMIDASERAKHVFKLTEYQGMNYTIMHTEFYRERAQPGMIIIGCDSHTCSSGALGCLSIGLGAADVAMPLVTGEIWFKVPEVINIRLVGAPPPGIGGKDVILYILKELNRNTVAADRVVEFTGPGVHHLSCDARFAIANMTTEFGGITGIFVPDQNTYDFVNKRRLPRHKDAAVYFAPDEDAEYAEKFEIDLAKVGSFVARYPNPDDVVPVAEFEGLKLDGCFIGACTTTEEDLIFAALVLEQGLQKGLTPVKGKRKVVPGSLPILQRLKELGMVETYERAGFEVGSPGCSYCVGISADRAGEGETWLSSQNRNFKNRMGKGSIGHITSAATVAASSFNMVVTDPQELIDAVDLSEWNRLKPQDPSAKDESALKIDFTEPNGSDSSTNEDQNVVGLFQSSGGSAESKATSAETKTLDGRVYAMGDFIDTDAIAPAEFLVDAKTNEEIGRHCFEHTNPEFRPRVKEGFNIIVAGEAFGCGSSREQAVQGLLGCGVNCVIAKSFAFIFGRNAPNLGLLAITIKDDAFYAAAADGTDISVDLTNKVITVGKDATFPFELSQMEEELFSYGGISSAFNRFGKSLFEIMCSPKGMGRAKESAAGGCSTGASLNW